MTAYKVTYASQGLLVKGYLILPEQGLPLPGLLYCRGGIGRVGMVQLSRAMALAKLGYVVFAPFYRGNEGGEGRDEFGGADRQDVFSALTLLRSLNETTSDPISVIGFSRGAVMALLAAKKCTGIGPVVVWSGVSDLRLTYEERVDLRRMLKRVVGHPRKEPDKYIDRSPVEWAEQVNSPILIIHGSEDDHVSPEHAYRLARALQAAGKEHSLLIREGLGHRFPKVEDEQTMMTIHLWIQRKLTQSSK
nr:prolyl oligopeptidase family serine peptidase [Paenibacillus sp. J2TS4]